MLRDLRTSAGFEGRLVMSDPFPPAVLLVMPIILILFMRNGMVPPEVTGGLAPDGIYQIMPGLATLFAFLLLGFIGIAFYREYGWNTWERLRVMPVDVAGFVTGKLLPYAAVGVLQLAALLFVGWAFLDMHITGSLVALAAVVLALCTCTVTLGFMLVACTRTLPQQYAIANLTAVLFGGIGGAFAAPSTYPEWAETIARLTPQYWAIQGFQDVLIRGAGLRDIAPNVAVLLGFSAIFVAVGAVFFDMSQEKEASLL